MSSSRRLLLGAGVVALSLTTVALAVATGAFALRALGDPLRIYEAFEGLAIAALAFTFVVLTTPRILRRVIAA